MIAPPAYLDLARKALADGDAGLIPEVEALSAAEIFTRFAVGQPESARYLGLLFLHRCGDASKAGDATRECMFGSMGLARLDVAADAGDDLAAGALLNAKTSPEALTLAKSMLAGSFRETTATEDAICFAAGAGDENALNAVLDEVVTCLYEGIRPVRDALHLGVTVARVGEHFGHASLMLRLCGLLLLLGELDEQEGYDDSKLALLSRTLLPPRR